MTDELIAYGPDGGSVAPVCLTGRWVWVVAAVGAAVVVLGGLLLA